MAPPGATDALPRRICVLPLKQILKHGFVHVRRHQPPPSYSISVNIVVFSVTIDLCSSVVFCITGYSTSLVGLWSYFALQYDIPGLNSVTLCSTCL